MDTVKAVVFACLPYGQEDGVWWEDDDTVFLGSQARISSGDDDAPRGDGTSDGGVQQADRLSSLPEELRSNIVARLPLRDALGTREISRRWRSVWPSTPLSLDDSSDLALAGCRHDRRIRAITRILHTHPGPFHSVRLLLTCFDQARPLLRVWARMLASKGTKELVLVNQPPPVDMDLPWEVLSCCATATLRRLWIAFFRFPRRTSGSHSESSSYPHLRELGLCATAMEASGLELMLRSSPVLETLALVASYDQPMRICVHGHPSLRCVVLWMSVADEIDVDDTCLLQRLILWKTTRSSGGSLTVKIARSPNLRVLGYLEPVLHRLQIGDTIIEAGTKVSPSTIIPSLQVLALKLCFQDKEQAKLLPCFLRCFPNISALHFESAESEKPTGKFNMSYWHTQAGSIECLSRHVKKLYFHGFSGYSSELAFLRFVVAEAVELEFLMITLSTRVINNTAEIHKKLVDLGKSYWASEEPKMFVNQFRSGFTFHRAVNCLVVDPFFSMENLRVPPNDS